MPPTCGGEGATGVVCSRPPNSNTIYWSVRISNKLVVLTTEWLPWLQTNWKDSGYEGLLWYWRLIAQGNPRGSCPLRLTTTIYLQPSEHLWFPHRVRYIKTMTVPSCYFEEHAYVITLSQKFWGLSVCCGCNMNWAVASHVALCN